MWTTTDHELPLDTCLLTNSEDGLQLLHDVTVTHSTGFYERCVSDWVSRHLMLEFVQIQTPDAQTPELDWDRLWGDLRFQLAFREMYLQPRKVATEFWNLSGSGLQMPGLRIIWTGTTLT